MYCPPFKTVVGTQHRAPETFSYRRMQPREPMGSIALCCQQVLGANQERWRVPQLCVLSNLQGASRDRWQELELERSQRVSGCQARAELQEAGQPQSESGRGGRPSRCGMSSRPETAAGTNSLPQLKLRALKPVLLPYRAPWKPILLDPKARILLRAGLHQEVASKLFLSLFL